MSEADLVARARVADAATRPATYRPPSLPGLWSLVPLAFAAICALLVLDDAV
jgi:hypothetical protein